MNEKLTQELTSKYPKIFRDGFHFECDDGWFNIIDIFCSCVQNHIETRNDSILYRKKQNADCDEEMIEQVQALQIKEKFGGIRLYMSYSDDFISAAAAFAERLSFITCESCGNPGKPIQPRYWISVKCKECENALCFGT